jgi:hypothetical protein
MSLRTTPVLAALAALAVTVQAGDPPAWTGRWAAPDGTGLELAADGPGFKGTIAIDSATAPAKGRVTPEGALEGTFSLKGKDRTFTARLDGSELVLAAGGAERRLARPKLVPRAGQVWTFQMQHDMTMRYRVLEVRADAIRYDIQMTMNGQPLGDAHEAEWPIQPEQALDAEAPVVEGMVSRRGSLTIAGRTFDVLITSFQGSTSWIPMDGKRATFPGVLRSEMEGQGLVMELMHVEEPR